MKTLMVAAATSLLTSTALAQSAAAPHDPVAVFPTHDLHQQIAQLVAEAKEKGSSSATLADYGSYKIQLSVRTKSGGAEVHAHWDDVMMVKEGHATLVTGGSVIGGESRPDGETLGKTIDGGQSHNLAPGDVFTVRAGTPHQTVVAAGTIYAAVVVKIHEP
ncbi:MAG: hypothetical protein WB622_11520 [Acidobacteriaceae bacterium]|jgi:mannose-6-phosphate isomerase-like protein (cupin superfamily)